MKKKKSPLVDAAPEQSASGERCSVASGSDFIGYAEPLGARIRLHPIEGVRTRLARAFFQRELFAYFENLASGSTGWGISYNEWLHIRGWRLIGFVTYERVKSIEEEINPNNGHDQRAASAQTNPSHE